MDFLDSFILYKLKICVRNHRENVFIDLYTEVRVGRDKHFPTW